MRFFWGGHFEFSKSAILIFFCFISVKNPALLYEVSFFSALWMVFQEFWKRSCPNFYAHDCNNVSRYVLSNLLSFIKLSYTFVVYLMWYRSVGWPTWVPWKNVFLLWYGLTIIHLGIHTASFYQLLTKKKCSSIDYRDKRTLFEYKK